MIQVREWASQWALEVGKVAFRSVGAVGRTASVSFVGRIRERVDPVDCGRMGTLAV